jgi:hypothetical protein
MFCGQKSTLVVTLHFLLFLNDDYKRDGVGQRRTGWSAELL